MLKQASVFPSSLFLSLMRHSIYYLYCFLLQLEFHPPLSATESLNSQRTTPGPSQATAAKNEASPLLWLSPSEPHTESSGRDVHGGLSLASLEAPGEQKRVPRRHRQRGAAEVLVLTGPQPLPRAHEVTF